MITVGLLSLIPFIYSRTQAPRVTNSKAKVIVIGLDGATWDVIDPLRDEGRLPNISSLIESGASGILKSEDPTISPALWTTIATGKSRTNHGVLNFFATQQSLQAKRVWEILSETERTVGVVSWMVTWPPPEHLNGFLIPSHLARGSETSPPEMSYLPQLVGSSRNGRPVGVYQRFRWGLRGIRNGLRLSTMASALNEWLYEKFRQPSYLDKNYRQQHLALRIYNDVFLSLRGKYQPDFSAIVFYGTDTLAHKYWRYFQPESFPDTDPAEVNRYQNVIVDYYVAVDEAIGEIVRSADKNTTVVIVSDHGTKEMAGGAVIRMPRLIGERLADKMGIRDFIDVTTVGNQVFFNIKKGAGQPDPPTLSYVAELLGQVELLGSVDPPFGIELVDVEGDEGDYVGIEFRLSENADDQYSPDRALKLPNGVTIELRDVTSLEFPVSGGHHLNGIIILSGPNIVPGTLDARLTDVTPTILYLMGMPVAKDMEGKVLSSAFQPKYVSEFPLQFVDTFGAPATSEHAESPLTKETLEKLKSLGYINE